MRTWVSLVHLTHTFTLSLSLVVQEPRLSIYGRARDEWSKLGRWVYNHNLSSPSVRWLIQIPRLYAIYKKMGVINNFAEMLAHIFVRRMT